MVLAPILLQTNQYSLGGMDNMTPVIFTSQDCLLVPNLGGNARLIFFHSASIWYEIQFMSTSSIDKRASSMFYCSFQVVGKKMHISYSNKDDMQSSSDSTQDTISYKHELLIIITEIAKMMITKHILEDYPSYTEHRKLFQPTPAIFRIRTKYGLVVWGG